MQQKLVGDKKKALRRVCLVGAGNIAEVHAEVLTGLDGVTIAAVIDPDTKKAEVFADRWRISVVHASIESAIEAGCVDCAHILVPPPVHKTASVPFLDAGLPVLIEKPMGVTAAECAELNALAASRGVTLAVNHNLIFHPVFRRLLEIVEQRELGKLQSVQAIHSAPLRQFANRQFGHWMFHSPLNLLLEQAIHPLSAISVLIGNFNIIQAIPGAQNPDRDAPQIFHQASVSLAGEHAHAQLYFSVGRSFPAQQLIAICDDGCIVADFHHNRLVVSRRTQWLESLDMFVSGERMSLEVAMATAHNAFKYGLSLLRLGARPDPFFLSMKHSIMDFHRSVSGRPPVSSGDFGERLVDACERITAAAFGETYKSARSLPLTNSSRGRSDVVLLGGTGFIGTATLRALLKVGMRVTVCGRNVENLPSLFYDPHVTMVRRDVRWPDDVRHAISGIPVVINLAQVGGASWAEVERDTVGSAMLVADSCNSSGARRLIHIGSIAALYLGRSAEVVTGQTPVDARAGCRAAYARGKAVTDQLLLRMHEQYRLPVMILRPGVVVGEGGNPFHSALGQFNNEQHCLGWNDGRNPIPFVLVEDVAAAIALAVETVGLEGRCYNLVGDVRLTAREYIAELAKALERPLCHHPQSLAKQQVVEVAKWLIKRAAGRADAFPSYHDLCSRGLVATIDCTDAKRQLGWTPVADRKLFIERAIAVHAYRRVPNAVGL